MSAAHVADYHLFKVESAIEFVSLSVQIVRWIREYQAKLFNGIMKDRPSPTTVSIVGTKRDHESDYEDPEGISDRNARIQSKQRHKPRQNQRHSITRIILPRNSQTRELKNHPLWM